MDIRRISDTVAWFSLASIAFAICCLMIFAFVTFLGLHMLGGPLAVVAVVFFILAFASGLVAIVLNTIGDARMKCYVIASLGVLLSVIPVYFISGVFLGAKARRHFAEANVGAANLRYLGREFGRYAEEHSGRLPQADQWCDELLKNNHRLSEYSFRHPQSRRIGLQGDCHFAFNRNLGGKQLEDLPGNVVLLFEADGDWNLNGTADLLTTRYRNNGYITVLFLNGTTGEYWFDRSAVRKLDERGAYDDELRWK